MEPSPSKKLLLEPLDKVMEVPVRLPEAVMLPASTARLPPSTCSPFFTLKSDSAMELHSPFPSRFVLHYSYASLMRLPRHTECAADCTTLFVGK